MAKLVVLLLIVSSILLSVISLPISDSDVLSNCYSKPHVLYPTEDQRKFRCHKCYDCPRAMGNSILCKGQRVNSEENVECVHCVTGSNYSNVDDYSQCVPCLSICKDQEIKGECVDDGDNRECVPCKKDWYYDPTNKTCKACSCKNMTEDAKQSCFDLGFNFELHCRHPVQTTRESSRPEGKRKKEMGAGIIVVIVVVLFVVISYCCYVGRNLKRIFVTQSPWPLGAHEWMYSIFCCHHSVVNQGENRGDADDAQPTSKPPSYGRQNSCPVTLVEINGITERVKTLGYHLIADSDSQESTPRVLRAKDCEKEKLKVHDLNAEVIGKMNRRLAATEVDIGTGFQTLVGRLGYSIGKHDDFKLTENPLESLLRYWSRTDVTNNVLKLQQILKGMKRDDLAKLLESELEKVRCPCSKCQLVL